MRRRRQRPQSINFDHLEVTNFNRIIDIMRSVCVCVSAIIYVYRAASGHHCSEIQLKIYLPNNENIILGRQPAFVSFQLQILKVNNCNGFHANLGRPVSHECNIQHKVRDNQPRATTDIVCICLVLCVDCDVNIECECARPH